MGAKCAPLSAHLFLHSYEQFIQKLHNLLAVAFNSTFRYIDDILSINNNQFHSYVDSIYPSELEIKETSQNHLLLLDTWAFC
jgi:hypothetical protein